MTALAAPRDTTPYGFGAIPDMLYQPLVAANVKCYPGAIACTPMSGTGAGYAKPGVTGTGLQVLGRFEEEFDNTGGAAGALSLVTRKQYAKIRSGAFWFANSASTDAITQAHALAAVDCFLVDDQTVALTDGGQTRSRAGKVLAVDAALGVLVLMGPVFSGRINGSNPKIQIVTGQLLSSGVKIVGGVGGTFSLTANSVIIPVITTKGAGAMGAHYVVDTITTGAEGTAVFTVTSTALAGTTVTTDVNTLAFVILG